MSQLKNRRYTSKAEFVNTASKLEDETFEFLTRLSARYARLMAQSTMDLANEVVNNAAKANSINPSSIQNIELRTGYLTKALAAVNALDGALTRAYRRMNKNPQGCFTKPSGATLSSGDACTRLEHMADGIGQLLDDEYKLLDGQLRLMERTKRKLQQP